MYENKNMTHHHFRNVNDYSPFTHAPTQISENTFIKTGKSDQANAWSRDGNTSDIILSYVGSIYPCVNNIILLLHLIMINSDTQG